VANIMRHPVELAMRWFLDTDIQGREHLPRAGPYIVTANHLSLLDPILVSVVAGRLVRFLALDELFGQKRILDESMLYFGSIPVSRDRPPLGALQHALSVLENDEVLGIFPEGARALYWGERTIKQGAAWLALATGAPIVPCSIIGTESTWSLAEPRFRIPAVKITLHPIIDPGSYTDREDPLSAMMDDWAAAIDGQIHHWKHEE
jgi:1-acyl-sn-glycerol-3-phosphate acyltransferase